MSPGGKIVGFLVSYYCVAMLTGAYYYQHRRDPTQPRQIMDAVMAGYAWPFYWSGRAALKITE